MNIFQTVVHILPTHKNIIECLSTYTCYVVDYTIFKLIFYIKLKELDSGKGSVINKTSHNFNHCVQIFYTKNIENFI